MAAQLEFYFNHNVTPANSESDTYSTHTTTTANRSGRAGTKNFFVLAHIVINADGTAPYGKVRLYQDGSIMLGECASGIHFDLEMQYTFNFVKRVSLDASSHTFEIQFARESGTGIITAENSSIVVLEESANAKYAETTAPAGTGAELGWEDFVTLTFTPDSEQQYLFFWATEIMMEDEEVEGLLGGRFINTTDTVVYAQETVNVCGLLDNRNDERWRTIGGVAYETVETSSHTYKIQMDGAGENDEVYMQRGAIVAIPIADFENVYTSNQTTKTFHLGYTFSDSDVVLSQAVNGADHLIIAGCEVSCESPTQRGCWQLVSDTVLFPIYPGFDDRDEDADSFYLSFLVHGQTLAAGTKAFKVQGTSSSNNPDNEGCINRCYMGVCEIPAAAPTYTPQLMEW